MGDAVARESASWNPTARRVVSKPPRGDTYEMFIANTLFEPSVRVGLSHPRSIAYTSHGERPRALPQECTNTSSFRIVRASSLR